MQSRLVHITPRGVRCAWACSIELHAKGIYRQIYYWVEDIRRIIAGVTGNSFLHRVKEVLEKCEFGL